MPRVRRRQAIEAAFVLGDRATAREILAALDVADRGPLADVPIYRDVMA
jgi:hypothetical protein